MPHPLVARIAAAALVVAAATAGLSSPAAAATCASGSGVSVVVDFGALGGGVHTACDAGTDQSAHTRFEESGFDLTGTQQHGDQFVCRVEGLPGPAEESCARTPPPDAYWGLFWSDGRSGDWVYSDRSVTSLKVPEGGSIALAWQGSATRRNPGTPAPVHRSPAPSPQPTKQPGSKPTTQPSSPTSTSPSAPAGPSSPPSADGPAPASPSASASPVPGEEAGDGTSARPAPRARDDKNGRRDQRAERTSEAPDPAPTDTAESTVPDPTAAAPDAGRLPTWLTIGVLLVLLASIAVTAVAARRRGSGGTGP